MIFSNEEMEDGFGIEIALYTGDVAAVVSNLVQPWCSSCAAIAVYFLCEWVSVVDY